VELGELVENNTHKSSGTSGILIIQNYLNKQHLGTTIHYGHSTFFITIKLSLIFNLTMVSLRPSSLTSSAEILIVHTKTISFRFITHQNNVSYHIILN